MADQPKKPRNIKDLKARLGRTVSPGQKPGGGAAVPPPGIGGPPPGIAGGGPVPPPGFGGGGVPAPGIPGAGGGVAPPPFGQPAPARRRPADPFSAAQPAQAAGPREVRLVIDEKPVDDAEVGRKARGRSLIIVGAGIVIGLIIGGGVIGTLSGRNTYNMAVQDGKDIYAAVNKSSDVVNKAGRLVDGAVTAARGGPGKSPTVDYEAIQQLRALKKPIQADAFSRKRYEAFAPGTVDDLFSYYDNVQVIWDKITALAATTLPKSKRKMLDQAAHAAENMATQPTGCVPVSKDNQFGCGLVFVTPPDDSGDQAPPPTNGGDQAAPKVKVSLTPGGRSFDKTIYSGQDLSDNPSQYVILTDTQHSVGVLGQQATPFAKYQANLLQLKKLLDDTKKVQGRLLTALGEIAKLEKQFTL